MGITTNIIKRKRAKRGAEFPPKQLSQKDFLPTNSDAISHYYHLEDTCPEMSSGERWSQLVKDVKEVYVVLGVPLATKARIDYRLKALMAAHHNFRIGWSRNQFPNVDRLFNLSNCTCFYGFYRHQKTDKTSCVCKAQLTQVTFDFLVDQDNVRNTIFGKKKFNRNKSEQSRAIPPCKEDDEFRDFSRFFGLGASSSPNLPAKTTTKTKGKTKTKAK